PAHAVTASPRAEASLSRRLHTPPLPATHAAVGNSWQNRRLCQRVTRSTAVTSATSCRTGGWFGAATAHPRQFFHWSNHCSRRGAKAKSLFALPLVAPRSFVP